MNQQDKERLRELAQDLQDLMDAEADLYGTGYWQAMDSFQDALSPKRVLALLEENERLAKDAERYAWVRQAGAWDSEIGLNSKTPDQYDTEVDWNVANAAMAKQGEK